MCVASRSTCPSRLGTVTQHSVFHAHPRCSRKQRLLPCAGGVTFRPVEGSHSRTGSSVSARLARFRLLAIVTPTLGLLESRVRTSAGPGVRLGSSYLRYTYPTPLTRNQLGPQGKIPESAPPHTCVFLSEPHSFAAHQLPFFFLPKDLVTACCKPQPSLEAAGLLKF